MKKQITLFCMFFCLLFTVKSQTTLTTAVDFTATDVHGNSLTLFDILDRGQYVLIDFFFTTCGPCQSATPSIVSMHNRFGCNEKDVFFIGVSPIDDDEDCHTWDATYGITYPTIGSDGGGSSICASYNIGAYPTVILIAPDRTIIEQDVWPVSGLASIFTTLGLEEFNCNTSSIKSPVPAENGLKMHVFPNPAADYITVELNSDIHDSYIEIFDITGCLVTKTAASNHSQLNISNLPGGIYIIKVGDSIAKFSKY